MSTLMQKRIARRIPQIMAGGKRITGGELVKSAGYSIHKQKKPGVVLRSPGVQEELGRLGFTEEKARDVVGQILADEHLKPEPRLKAAEMVFKVEGSFAPEKRVNVNIDVVPTDAIKKLAAELIEQQRSRIVETQ